MTDFNSMTVLELRKYAREHGVTIGAGKSKADIIDLLIEELKEKQCERNAQALKNRMNERQETMLL